VPKGNPNAVYDSQRVDYVKVQINGASVLSDGTRAQGARDDPMAHIPLVEWLSWPNWSSGLVTLPFRCGISLLGCPCFESQWADAAEV
jgi:hypothetical protein